MSRDIGIGDTRVKVEKRTNENRCRNEGHGVRWRREEMKMGCRDGTSG
jgi:hypothetical protein